MTVTDLLTCEALTFPLFKEATELTISTNFYHLAKDRRILCSDAEYQRYRAGAWAVGVIFGIAGPLACILYGSLFSTETFHYLTDGLRPQAWFWELVTMFRRAAILAIVTIIEQQSVVMMSYVVLNYFYLMLTLRMQPYDGSDMYNVLECFGTSTMVVVAQLLVMLSAYPSQEYVFVILVSLVILSSILVLLAAGGSLLRAWYTSKNHPELAVDAKEEGDNTVQGIMEEFELQLKGCDTKFYVGLRSTYPLKGYPRVSHGQNIKLKRSGVTGTVVGTDTPKGVLYWKRNGCETCEICAKNADDFEEKYTCLQSCDSLEGTFTQYLSPEDLAKKSSEEKVKNQDHEVHLSHQPPRQSLSGKPEVGEQKYRLPLSWMEFSRSSRISPREAWSEPPGSVNN